MYTSFFSILSSFFLVTFLFYIYTILFPHQTSHPHTISQFLDYLLQRSSFIFLRQLTVIYVGLSMECNKIQEPEEGIVALDEVSKVVLDAGEGGEKREEKEREGTEPAVSLPCLDEVEEILGYKFKDKALLEEALTHVSFLDRGCSYERLEYMGDSVLNLIFTKEQFLQYPKLLPGALTRLRAANVDTEKLARVAVKLGLHRYLRHRKPMLEEQIQAFCEAILDYPLHSNGLVEVPKVLADIVESTVGAVFIDCNFSMDTVWKVFKDLLEPIINQETLMVHPVTQLYEMCQKRNLKVKFVDLWHECMAFNVFIEDQLVGRATYGLKKEIAHNRAAKDALNNIGRILPAEKDDNTESTDL